MSYIKIIFEFQFILKAYCSFFQYVKEIGGGSCPVSAADFFRNSHLSKSINSQYRKYKIRNFPRTSSIPTEYGTITKKYRRHQMHVSAERIRNYEHNTIGDHDPLHRNDTGSVHGIIYEK